MLSLSKYLWMILFVVTSSSNAANILDIMGCPSPSHHIWHTQLVNALAARGHNVTVLSTDRDLQAPENVTYVHMEGVYDLFYKEHNINLVHNHNESSVDSVHTLFNFGLLACEGCLRSSGVQQLLAYPDSFHIDLILYDYTLGPCLLGFQHKFDYPPMVGVTAFNIPAYTVELLGGHNYYAYIPYFSLSTDMTMMFWDRLLNVYLYMYEYIQRNYYFTPAIHAMAAEVFGPTLPYVGSLELKTKIALVNSHPAIDYPEPLSPNVIAVGGLQVRPTPDQLPEDIEDFIRSSRKAAVLFALGTNVRSDMLGLDKQQALLEAFGRMPEYNFLWKFESDDKWPTGATPRNVLIRSWLPQNDILAHPKVKAFITHAGTLSTHEATWHAVPMVAIPFFVDQVRNSFKSMRDGVAEIIRYEDISASMVEQKVRLVLEDSSYQTNMDIRSARFRDQPEHPLSRAVWWIEYMLRNPNPQHLQSPVLEIGSFVANSYDIIMICNILAIAICVLATRITCRIFKVMLKKTSRNRKDSQKKNE